MLQMLVHIWEEILKTNLFNFILMLILLNWIIQKFGISEKLEQGRKSIEDRINNSKLAKENATKELFKLQEKSKEINQQALDILEKSNKNAMIVGQNLVQEAKKQATEFGKNLDKIIESNQKSVQNKLNEKTAKASIEIAKNYIQERLQNDRTLHIKFINESIDELNGVEF
jgi:F0F1-type ATP synthase membrane subunit b/b'